MVSKQKPVVFDDDNPEWTEEDFARARPADEFFSKAFIEANLVRPRGRPKQETTRKQVTLRMSPDVLDALRATGKGWQTRADAILRQALGL